MVCHSKPACLALSTTRKGANVLVRLGNNWTYRRSYWTSEAAVDRPTTPRHFGRKCLSLTSLGPLDTFAARTCGPLMRPVATCLAAHY